MPEIFKQNNEYQSLYNVSKRTATNDLDKIVQKKIFEKVGTRGKGTFYTIKISNHAFQKNRTTFCDKYFS